MLPKEKQFLKNGRIFNYYKMAKNDVTTQAFRLKTEG